MKHLLVVALTELRHRMPRFTAFAPAVILICALTFAVTIGASHVLAQVSSNRHVDVTVTDPLGRFVTGLGQDNFEVVENGVRHPITGFSDVDSPISIAIVTGEPLPGVGLLDPKTS